MAPQLGGGIRSTAAAVLAVTTFLVCYHFESINDRFYYDRMTLKSNTNSPIIRRSLLAEGDPSKKRLALVRPFGPHDAHSLVRSFDLWSTYWPCTARNDEYDVDLVLAGHYHSYLRSSRIKHDKRDDAEGIYHYTIGWARVAFVHVV